jgi:hypothetical protein
MFSTAFIVAVLPFASLVTAHPGVPFDRAEHMDELANAHAVAEVNAQALKACENRPDVLERKERAVARRAATFERLRMEHGLSDGVCRRPFQSSVGLSQS